MSLVCGDIVVEEEISSGGHIKGLRTFDDALELIERLGCCFGGEEMDKVLNRGWIKDAKCKGVPVKLFFPVRGEPSDSAKMVCRGCPVRKECLEYALVLNEQMGIWGGVSERERRIIRRALRKRLNFICGVLPDGWDFDRKLLNSNQYIASEMECDDVDLEIDLYEDDGKELSCG
jgi:WhiB family redox-sensing transcriptional regulator